MTLKRIFGRAVLEIGLFSFVVNILLLVQPLYLLQIYDRVLTSGSMSTLLYITVIFMAAFVLMGFLEAVRSIYASRVANRLDSALASNAMHVAMYGPKAASGEVPVIQDLSTVRNFITSRTLFFLFDLPFAPLFLVLLYFIHPALFYMTLAGVVVLIVITVANQLMTKGQLSRHAKANAESNALAQTFARNSETIRAMGMTFNVIEQWGGKMSEVVRENDGYQWINSLFTGISRFIRMGLQIAILCVGAYYVLAGEMTAGMIFASSIIAGRALQPLDQIIGAWRHVQTAWSAFRRVLPLARLKAEQQEGSVLLPDPSGAITAENLTYFLPNAMPGSEAVIKRMNFDIKAGECLGIVGPSGAGKSTLARLLVGAIRPSQGSVAYDSADIGQWLDADRGRHVGYLGQEIEFFPGTIAQNIARFEPGFSDEDVIRAARKAGAHDLIVGRIKGYSTELGPNGERLSGGERQRLALARAFYGKPAILVLDEPNSNLDKEGETALETAIRGAKADGRTVIIITHRPSIAPLCDRLMVMRQGMIDMLGPTQAVLEALAKGDRGRPAAAPAAGPANTPSPAAPAQKAPAPAGTTQPAPANPAAVPANVNKAVNGATGETASIKAKTLADRISEMSISNKGNATIRPRTDEPATPARTSGEPAPLPKSAGNPS
ncbi:MAG: type I secretion system permease/ATPase [Phyllobacteriaceae bacterium]|nr:type I secretion system permease/ATPase [Phyllobacteriaceae bacterium]MBA92800.1 type I secretion system permease/ATPase [Phyllobacteriaceae bacterium]